MYFQKFTFVDRACLTQVRTYYKSETLQTLRVHSPGDSIFSAQNDVISTTLNVWCQIKNLSNDAYLLEDGERGSSKFHPDPI